MLNITLSSGVHGNEQCAVLATKIATDNFKHDNELVVRNIGPLNRRGLRDCVREVTDDPEPTNDLNRKFAPASTAKLDDIDGITKYVKNMITYADIVIDVHNSPACANTVLISNNGFADRYVEHCNKHDIPFILWESNTDTIKKYAQSEHKVGITIELGGMGGMMHLSQIIEEQWRFIAKVVESFRGEDSSSLQRFYGERDVYFYPADKMWQPVYAHSEGILDYMYDVGAEVKKGDVIATVRNDSTDIDVVSPCNGWIVEIHDNLWVQPGNEFCHVQPVI